MPGGLLSVRVPDGGVLAARLHVHARCPAQWPRGELPLSQGFKRRSGGETLQVEGGRSRARLVSADSVSLEEYKHVLGGEKLAYAVKPSRHQEESIFFVEGLSFPDASFSGLVSFHVTLLESPEKVTP